MSTDKVAAQDAPINPPLSMQELTALLIKHYGIHEGRYNLAMEFQISSGAVGPDPTHLLPGLVIGMAKVGLSASITDDPTTVDAALVNPAKPARKKKTA